MLSFLFCRQIDMLVRRVPVTPMHFSIRVPELEGRQISSGSNLFFR